MTEKCKDCLMECADHPTQKLLVSQLLDRTSQLEGMVIENSNDNNNMEGRLSTFMYIMGFTFFFVASMAYIGMKKIDAYEEKAAAMNLAYTEKLGELTAVVTVSSERSEDVKNGQNALNSQITHVVMEQEHLKSELLEINEELNSFSDHIKSTTGVMPTGISPTGIVPTSENGAR